VYHFTGISGSFKRAKSRNDRRGQAVFCQERDKEIGDLAAGMVSGFVAGNLAPKFYNQGVDNVCWYMREAPEERMGIRV